jgi:hypothetical protein
VLHFFVFQQSIRNEAIELFVARDIDQAFGQFGAQSFVLPFVRDDYRKFCQPGQWILLMRPTPRIS